MLWVNHDRNRMECDLAMDDPARGMRRHRSRVGVRHLLGDEGAALVTMLPSFPWPKPCNHSWQVRGVQHGTHTQSKGDITIVLYVCLGCGEAKSDLIDGNWTEDQLRL